MSRLNIPKKLRPAKKAWKSFTNTLKSKIHNLNISDTITTATRRLTSAVQSLRFLIASKWPRSLTKPSYTCKRHSQSQTHFHNNFLAVHIDELFAEKNLKMKAKTSHADAATSRGKEVMIDEKILPKKSETGLYSIEDAWNRVVASSPHLREVDERAEEFITKFRQDMKLQKEKSLLEFQEMLIRSA